MAWDLIPIPLADGQLRWSQQFWPAPEADALFAALHQEIVWRQEYVTLYGKRYPQPRLSAWYGDGGTTYRYSGLTLTPQPWTPLLQQLKSQAEAAAAATFNSVLLNFYRSGADGMGWHSDDEPELGHNPVIASLSFGGTRRFILRHRQRALPKVELALGHGSLLVMGGATQHHWQHRVPKTAKVVPPRINLTFRQLRLSPGADRR